MNSDDDPEHFGFKPVEHYKAAYRDFNLNTYRATWVGSPGGDKWIVAPQPHVSFQWNGNECQNGSGLSVSGAFGSWQEPSLGHPTMFVHQTDPELDVIPDIPNQDQYIDKAMKTLLPGIRPVTSLPVSLYEIGDIAHMATLARDIAHNIRDLEAFWDAFNRELNRSKIYRYPGNLPLMRWLGLGANWYLNDEFNIKPLLSDIAALQRGLRDSQMALRQLLTNANKPQLKHFHAPIEEFAEEHSLWDGTIVPSYLVGGQGARRDVVYPTRLFAATIEYSYTIPEMSEGEYALNALWDRLGFNMNPALIWKAIPWTFVVDWVVNVSELLDQFKLRAIQPKTRIRQFCCSHHVVRDITTYFSSGISATSGNAELTLSYHADAYKRIVIRAADFLLRSVSLTGMNPKEFTLIAALALSKLKRARTPSGNVVWNPGG